ncbi:MAG: sensor histidine kinase [Chitinophagaceae bacterium]|nr:sensor histidine kinase [Chitinophagaceae bacterium]
MSQSRASSLIIHLAGWLIFLSLPVLFMSRGEEGGYPFSILLSYQYWLFGLTYIFLFYFHSSFLIPGFYLQKQYKAYGIIIFLLFTLVFFLKPFDQLVSQGVMPPPRNDIPHGPPPPGGIIRLHGRGLWKFDIVSTFLFFMVLALGMATQISRRWRMTEQRAARAEADKTKAELSFLKAQINPHFLFNTLNNIYSLAISKSEHTAESIMKLSNIMRYVTDETIQDFVPLESEVSCVADYIDLQRLRLGKKVTLDFTVTGNPHHKKIPPLVLMTFVENVFKYGVSSHEASEITISINADEKGILFYSRNRIFNNHKVTERSGIGIDNTKKRLNHLYPGAHSLLIKNENGFFTVALTLPG